MLPTPMLLLSLLFVGLIALLHVGSTQDGRIALFLAKRPDRAALPAIDAALQRATGLDRDWLEEARAACAR